MRGNYPCYILESLSPFNESSNSSTPTRVEITPTGVSKSHNCIVETGRWVMQLAESIPWLANPTRSHNQLVESIVWIPECQVSELSTFSKSGKRVKKSGKSGKIECWNSIFSHFTFQQCQLSTSLLSGKLWFSKLAFRKFQIKILEIFIGMLESEIGISNKWAYFPESKVGVLVWCWARRTEAW